MAPTLWPTDWPLPGGGQTWERWQRLSATAQRDVVEGRLIEAHTDADAILAELEGRRVEPGTRWGVWAANAPGHHLELRDGRLFGSKAWCSGATLLTHALVTVDDVLVEVDLSLASPGPLTWEAAGMRAADTRSVSFEGTPCRVINGSYLERPGFWQGAIGVAACWYGAMLPLVRPLQASVKDEHAAAHLGAIASALTACRFALHQAAWETDTGHSSQQLAFEVRSLIADTTTDVARRVGRALGPSTWASVPGHAQRLADLEVYVRQDHVERDLATLGHLSVDEDWSL